jgi:NAD-dependent SIR2 family protein deacetylase
MLNAFPSELIAETRRGNAVAFVGAGMSISSGGPSWRDLIEKMLSELDIDLGYDSSYAQLLAAVSGDASAEARLRELYLAQHNPLVVAQLYEKTFGRHGIINLLRASLETLGAPTDAHRELLALPLSAVITTNYDDLLERACALVGRDVSTVLREEDVAYLDRERLPIIKMHGSLLATFDANSIVISRSDYDNYQQTHPNIAALLSFLMTTRSLILVGYSVSDPNFLMIHNEVWYHLRQHRRKIYWLTFGLPSALFAYWNDYGIYPILLDGADKTNAIAAWCKELLRRAT